MLGSFWIARILISTWPQFDHAYWIVYNIVHVGKQFEIELGRNVRRDLITNSQLSTFMFIVCRESCYILFYLFKCSFFRGNRNKTCFVLGYVMPILSIWRCVETTPFFFVIVISVIYSRWLFHAWWALYDLQSMDSPHHHPPPLRNYAIFDEESYHPLYLYRFIWRRQRCIQWIVSNMIQALIINWKK